MYFSKHYLFLHVLQPAPSGTLQKGKLIVEEIVRKLRKKAASLAVCVVYLSVCLSLFLLHIHTHTLCNCVCISHSLSVSVSHSLICVSV